MVMWSPFRNRPRASNGLQLRGWGPQSPKPSCSAECVSAISTLSIANVQPLANKFLELGHFIFNNSFFIEILRLWASKLFI